MRARRVGTGNIGIGGRPSVHSPFATSRPLKDRDVNRVVLVIGAAGLGKQTRSGSGGQGLMREDSLFLEVRCDLLD